MGGEKKPKKKKNKNIVAREKSSRELLSCDIYIYIFKNAFIPVYNRNKVQ